MAQRGFLDKVLQFMGIQEEEVQEEPQAREESPRPAPSSLANADGKRRARVVSLPSSGRSSSSMRVSVMRPRAYDEVQQIADHLKERQPVIVSLEGMDKDVARRIIDFVSGTTYALDGSIHRIGDEIFLFAPLNVTIDSSWSQGWSEEEIFPQ